VFADRAGQVVHLFERDCSIQRRHQKVLEEAPAPGMTAARREAMGQAAIAAARAVGYVGAGTVEFIAEGEQFHFMEMNTRLQVEHPVTEMITGQELVEWQIRVAAGEALPCTQADLRISGHAIEARIYAEDPAEDFRPSTGRLLHLVSPPASAAVRIDTGVRQGDEITAFYDPMIAKLIVHGADRAEAVARLRSALAQYEVVGVQTNLGLLRAIAAEPAFAAADLDTGFIGRHAHLVAAPDAADETTILAAAALAVLRDQRAECEAAAQRSADPWSPWAAMDSWRMNVEGWHELHLRMGGKVFALRAYPDAGDRVRLVIEGAAVYAVDEGTDIVRLDGIVRRMPVVRRGQSLTVVHEGRPHPVSLVDPYAPPGQESAGAERVIALTPGRLVRVLVGVGAAVTRGAPLVVIEAMKMEMTLKAPRDGVVESLRFAEGDLVTEGAELVVLADVAVS
jgi:3-methylcrotonyl-CoA carboxylase alpha subunit